MSDSTTIAVNCRCNPAEIEGWSYVQWIGTYFGDCVRSPLERMSFGMGLLSLMLFLVATFPQMVSRKVKSVLSFNIHPLACLKRKNYIRKRVDGLSFGLLGTWALGDLSNYFGTIFTGQLATQRLTAFYFLGTDIIMLWQYVYYRFYYQRFGFVVPKLNAGAEEEDEDDDQEEAASNERRPLLQSINNYNNISISTSYSSAIPDEEEVFLSGSAASASAGNIAITDDSPPPLTRAYLLVLLFQFLLSWVLLFTMEYVAGILIYHIGGDTTGNDREFCDTTEPLPAWLVIAGSMMAWISGTLYFTSRIPQILVNHQTKSVEALSLVGWIIIILGNAFYGLSILFRLPNASDAKFYQSTLPYIIGSAGTITFDFVILFQAYLYGGFRRSS